MSKGKKKDLTEVCLHCLFIKAHQDKWPKWTPTSNDTANEAFQDLVHSAIKIVVNVFVYLDEADQMRFMQEVMDKSKKLEEGKVMLSKILDTLKPRGPTQH
jgi:hypothetical protein